LVGNFAAMQGLACTHHQVEHGDQPETERAKDMSGAR
jgi:hypothetical protein